MSRFTTRHRRPILAGCAVATAVVAYGSWMAYTAYHTQSELSAARDQIMIAKTALLEGDTDAARTAAERADRHSSNAADATASIPWSVAEGIPFLGSSLTTVEQIARAAATLTHDVLPPALDAGTALTPSELLERGGRVDVQKLRAAGPALDRAASAATRLAEQADDIEQSTLIGAVADARSELQRQAHDLAGLLSNTRTAAQLLPDMLGGNGDRRYFMAFQTNAEARGTGGLLGGFAVLAAGDGAVRVDELAANKEIALKQRPLDLGPEFDRLYGRHRPTTDWRNSNLSPHFPYAGRIWQSIWEQESGTVVDGAIATDPVALGYVLDVIGPVTMHDGEIVSGDNVVELTESTAYARFADDNNARKAYLQELAARVVTKMTSGVQNPAALLDALGRAVSERRIAVWSAHPEEQEVLAATPLGYTVPGDAAPYANVVVNNAAGNKLDYYLTRDIRYVAGTCETDTRRSTVSVTLGNETPNVPLSDYVAGMVENTSRAEPGTSRMLLSLYGTQGSELVKVSSDKAPLFALTGTELGHPVYTVDVEIPRGQTRTVTFELTEPTAAGAPRVPLQPLVAPATVTTDVPRCG